MWKYFIFVAIALNVQTSQCLPSEKVIEGFTRYDVSYTSKSGESISQSYFFSSYQAELVQAGSDCISNGLTLVSIQDEMENNVLRPLVAKQGGGFHWTDGLWSNCALRWNTTGALVTFTNWRDYGGGQFENFPAITIDGEPRNWLNHVIGDGYVERFICE